MKVLFLANLNPNKFGSIEEHALVLSSELRRRGHECYLGFIEDPKPENRERFEAAGARILKIYCGDTHLIGNNTKLKIHKIISLYRMVRDNKIDVVHVHFIGLTNSCLWGIYLTRAKILFTEHASGRALPRNPIKHVASRMLHFLVSCRVAKYIAVSEYVRRRLLQTHHVGDKETLTIYNGVNIERFKPCDLAHARRELGLPLDRKILCTVAMLIPEKGIQNLIRAVEYLVHVRNVNDILAIIVGEGYYRAALEQSVEELQLSNHVQFLGRRSDVQTIVAASDVVVVPSVWEEAFGLIIAESMACARPVVASNIGGIPELVEDGVTGRLVAPEDSKALALGIYALLAERADREKMGKAGRKKAEKMFDLQRQIEKIIDIYETIY